MIEKKTTHHDLTVERWRSFSTIEQLANVGSDVERAIRWKQKGRPEDSLLAVERALELMDLTIADPKNNKRLKELLRVRNFFADQYMGINEFGFTDDYWQNYFMDFAYLAARARGR